MNIENWLLFASIAFIAAVTPGPAILLATTHAIAYGLKKALTTILGNISGLLCMSALSVLGLSTVLLYSSTIFMVIKFAGAAYLIYLGIRLWRFGFSPANQDVVDPEKIRKTQSSTSLYLQGLFVALTNPKAIAFTTALFPQFIDPAQALTMQFSILVATFMSLSFICLLGYCHVAVNMKNSASVSGVSRYMGKAFGSAFIVSGFLLASASHK